MEKLTLRQYLSIKTFKGELSHLEIYANGASIDELSINNFTEEGLKKWKNVLDMTIENYIPDRYGETLVLNGGKDCEKETDNIEKFTYALAGYVADSLYQKWFTFKD